MECFVRVCKDNQNGNCQRFKNPEELAEAFKKAEGCALTWFFTGQLPKKA